MQRSTRCRTSCFVCRISWGAGTLPRDAFSEFDISTASESAAIADRITTGAVFAPWSHERDSISQLIYVLAGIRLAFVDLPPRSLRTDSLIVVHLKAKHQWGQAYRSPVWLRKNMLNMWPSALLLLVSQGAVRPLPPQARSTGRSFAVPSSFSENSQLQVLSWRPQKQSLVLFAALKPNSSHTASRRIERWRAGPLFQMGLR